MATLTPEMFALLEVGAAHQIGACTAEGLPAICRGLAVTVDSHGRVLAILSAQSGYEVVAAVRANGRVSVNVTHPATYQSLNLAGTDAEIREASTMRPLVNQRHKAFQRALAPYGFPPGYTDAFYEIPDTDLVAIRFTPIVARNQTPGIGAGGVVELAS